MSARRLSPLLRPTPPSVRLGIGVAVALITAETLLVVVLRDVARDTVPLGVVYLVGVLVVSTVWGLPLGVATALLSTAAFDFFNIEPEYSLAPVRARDWLALAVFLVVALLLGSVAELARARASALEASRDELRLLADEQTALRRVATLVARGVPAAELFGAAAAEVRGLLGADATRLLRYEPDGTAVDVGGETAPGVDVASETGTVHTLRAEQIAGRVARTGRPARFESYEGVAGPVAAHLRAHDIRSSVGAPVVVEGRLWGVMIAAWTRKSAASADTEERMAQFTELIATAIANASSRAELAASRARVVSASDEGRRRLVRDLHDGVQQRLVQTMITLKLAKQAMGDAGGPGAELVSEALDHAGRANAELRDLAHGILPVALARGGLRAGIATLVDRVRLPVSVEVSAGRMPAALEATAYFIVAEALTNTVKHADASRAEITAEIQDGFLRIAVRDDGVGGAHTEGSSGLVGLFDRAAALNGTLEVESPPGGGTLVAATLPLSGP
jgi:signal transduction histidine kinase